MYPEGLFENVLVVSTEREKSELLIYLSNSSILQAVVEGMELVETNTCNPVVKEIS